MSTTQYIQLATLMNFYSWPTDTGIMNNVIQAISISTGSRLESYIKHLQQKPSSFKIGGYTASIGLGPIILYGCSMGMVYSNRCSPSSPSCPLVKGGPWPVDKSICSSSTENYMAACCGPQDYLDVRNTWLTQKPYTL